MVHISVSEFAFTSLAPAIQGNEAIVPEIHQFKGITWAENYLTWGVPKFCHQPVQVLCRIPPPALLSWLTVNRNISHTLCCSNQFCLSINAKFLSWFAGNPHAGTENKLIMIVSPLFGCSFSNQLEQTKIHIENSAILRSLVRVTEPKGFQISLWGIQTCAICFHLKFKQFLLMCLVSPDSAGMDSQCAILQWREKNHFKQGDHCNYIELLV